MILFTVDILFLSIASHNQFLLFASYFCCLIPPVEELELFLSSEYLESASLTDDAKADIIIAGNLCFLLCTCIKKLLTFKTTLLLRGLCFPFLGIPLQDRIGGERVK